MEWWVVLSFFFGGVVLILLSGFPVAFAFLALDLLGVWIFMGSAGFENVALHIFSCPVQFRPGAGAALHPHGGGHVPLPPGGQHAGRPGSLDRESAGKARRPSGRQRSHLRGHERFQHGQYRHARDGPPAGDEKKGLQRGYVGRSNPRLRGAGHPHPPLRPGRRSGQHRPDLRRQTADGRRDTRHPAGGHVLRLHYPHGHI